MRRSHLFAVVLLLTACLLPSLTHAWSDGQPADLVLGQSNFTSNATATTQNGLNFALGVAVDPTTGKVFVADSGNNRVLRFGSLASLSNGADAEAVLGHADFTSNPQPNPVTQSSMGIPYNLTVDSGGRLWVADSSNNRVLRFDNAASKPDGANADGVLGQPNFTSNTTPIPPTQSSMSWPTDVTTDSSGRLWVAERFNRRVLRFDNAASKPDGADADGVLGQPDFVTRTITTTQSGMNNPYSVEIDSGGRLWVTDNSNRRVLRFDSAASKSNGANADGVLGQPDFTSTTSGLTQSGMFAPAGLAVDSTGRLWVADGGHNRVLRFDNAASKTNGANADGVLGQPDFTSDATTLTANSMNGPFGLAIDSVGNLWVADNSNSRILLFKDAVQVTITRADANPTDAATANFNVTFSSPIAGLNASNFTITTSGGISGASIANVTGSGTAWTATVTTGNGKGTLRLDMTSSSGVQDGNGNPVANLPYTGGETYTVARNYIVALPLLWRTDVSSNTLRYNVTMLQQ
jgi:sugar lactone lactonase YvrE